MCLRLRRAEFWWDSILKKNSEGCRNVKRNTTEGFVNGDGLWRQEVDGTSSELCLASSTSTGRVGDVGVGNQRLIILSKFNPVQKLLTYFSKTCYNADLILQSIHRCTSFSEVFQSKVSKHFVFFSMSATWPSRLCVHVITVQYEHNLKLSSSAPHTRC